MTGKLSGLVSDFAEKIDRSFGWARLPTVAAIPILIGLRDRLRENNLYDTGRGPLDEPPFEDPDVARHLGARMLNGTYNDLDDPRMGALGSRFGRNIPLEHTYPRSCRAARAEPAPDQPRAADARAVPARDDAQRARRRPGSSSRCTTGCSTASSRRRPVGGRPRGGRPVARAPDADPPHQARPEPRPERGRRPRSRPRPTGGTCRRCTASKPDFADGAAHGEHGKLRIDDRGLPPEELEQTSTSSGSAASSGSGLAILHSLFMREHNAICDHLTAEYPELSDDQLYDKARLVLSALMAKIHTVEWTPAIIAHPTTVLALRATGGGCSASSSHGRSGGSRRTRSCAASPARRRTITACPTR